MALKKTTVRLSVDAYRTVKLHMADHPNIDSVSHAINDILMRYDQLLKASASSNADTIDDAAIELIREQAGTLSQLTTVSLRNFGLIIEIAKNNDPSLVQKGEATARSLFKQMKES